MPNVENYRADPMQEAVDRADRMSKSEFAYNSSVPDEVKTQLQYGRTSLKTLEDKRNYLSNEIERLNTLLTDTLIAMDALRALLNNLPEDNKLAASTGAGMLRSPAERAY